MLSDFELHWLLFSNQSSLDMIRAQLWTLQGMFETSKIAQSRSNFTIIAAPYIIAIDNFNDARAFS